MWNFTWWFAACAWHKAAWPARDQKRFQSEVLTRLALLRAHKQGAGRPDAVTSGGMVPDDTPRIDLMGKEPPRPALEAPRDPPVAMVGSNRGQSQ